MGEIENIQENNRFEYFLSALPAEQMKSQTVGIEYLRREEQDEREEGKTGEDPKVARGSDKKTLR